MTEAPTSDLEARTGATEQIDPRLPHERDESAPVNEQDSSSSANDPGPRGIIKRAHRDLAQGQVDTDCRNKTEETIARKSGRGLRKKP